MRRLRFSLRVANSWWWLILAALLVLTDPRSAGAHASLTASEPANDAVLARAPAILKLTFSEPVDPLSVKLIDASGVAASISRIERQAESLILTPPAPLGAGAHVLSWRVVSADGHPVGGSLTFWIGQRGGELPAITVTDNVPRHAAIWIARLAVYLALFVGAGGALFIAWNGNPSAPRAPRRACATTSIVGFFAVVVSVGLQGLDVTDLPANNLANSAVWLAGASGSFGRSAAAAAAALGLGLGSLIARGAAARVLSLAALAGVGLALAASGHAANASPRALAFASVFLHGCAGAFWVGALMPLGFAIGTGADEAKLALRDFSRTVSFVVAALLVSGLVLAVVQLAGWDVLWTTAYGRILCLKIVLVLLLLGIASWNRWVLTPQIAAGSEPGRGQMRRSITLELLLVVLILGVVGLWRFTSPPRALGTGDNSFFTHVHTEQAMANITISPNRAGAIEIVIQLETPSDAPLIARALSVTLANPAIGIEAARAEAQDLGDGQWRVRMSAPVRGRWTLGLGILISDFDKISIEAPVLIK